MGGIVQPRTIRGQLSRILALALILVLALLTVTVFREVSDYRESNDTARAVSLALTVQDLTDHIQRELGLSNGLLGGDNALAPQLIGIRGMVDETLARVTDAANSDAPGADQVRTALSQLSLLGNTRTQIDTRRISRPVVFQFYSDAASALSQLTLGLDHARDAQIQRGLQAFYALGAAKEQIDKERGFLNGVFVAGRFSGGEFMQLIEIRATKLAAVDAFSRYASKERQADLDHVMLGENAAKAEQSESVALASGDGPLARGVDPLAWWQHMSGVIDGQRAVQQAVGNDVQDRADELRSAASTKLTIYLVGAAIAIIAMIVLVLTSVRAIVRPLATLADEADDVASRRLPDIIDAWTQADDTRPDAPAPVHTPRGASLEIAAVAGALDRVQTTAFELASQQALIRRNTTESMGNLARRNQNLVRRQLALISEFEREELDPQGLSNLFELDHLATRMRRNAESLLVLVGEGSPRRWAQPIALSDVIRAGLSEVDDYRRVVLRRVDDVLITGAVVSELAHMLAELIENGLAFSPPDLEVEIYGRRHPQGYLLAVVDHGVGMPPEQLAQSNAKLRGEQDFIVAPTRYLGHYVVGRLAERLGIAVELNTSPVSGIVARLALPLEILATGQHQPSTVQAKITGTGVERSWGSDSEKQSASELPSAPDVPSISEAQRAAALEAARTEAITAARQGNSKANRPPEFDTAEFAVPSFSGPVPAAPERNGTGRRPAHAAPEPAEPPRPDADPVYATGEQPVVRTTRNGLVKRNKRSHAAGAASEPESRAEVGTPPPVVERSPDETRSMLSSFRAGHERGTPTTPTYRPRPGATDNDTRADGSAPTAQSVTIPEENR